MRKIFCRIGVVAGLCTLAATSAYADYPEKPIKLVAATGPGGTADMLARGLAEALSKSLGQSVVVENKPGAEQLIGLQYVARGQPADGYTAILMGLDGQALLPVLKKGLRFDPIHDFTLLGGIGEGRYVLAGPADAPHKDLKSLMDYAKAHPGKLNYGSSGPTVQVPSLALLNKLGVNAIHVPYPATGPYLTAIASGTVDWGILGEANATHLKSRVRIYAVTGNTRSQMNPEVPSFTELGFPGIVGPAYAFAVRTGTPAAIVEKLTAALGQAMNSPEVKQFWSRAGIEARSDSAETARRTLMDRYAIYQELAKAGTIKAD